jgi:ATP phosphoribosyltransferase regulatory subunit
MTSLQFSAERPLPEGVRDLLFADAAAVRAMVTTLTQLWETWGYHEVILPTFEYASTLATDVGAEIDAEMYRFFDRQGRTLALRPDMTIPTARIVGTRLYDQPMPLRLCYSGSVFRYEPPRAGRQHEFLQAGVELIGAPGATADAESVALAVAALRALGVPEFRVTVGHVEFFRGLLKALDWPERQAARLRQAMDHKAEADLELLLREADTAPDTLAIVLALPRLIGTASVLQEAERLCLNEGMLRALRDLQSLNELLVAYGVADYVTYDLAEVRDLDYYTGITFEGFAPGLGFNLISGGRYDDLIGHFGPSQPAVGWALVLDRILLAREQQGVVAAEPVADVLLNADDCNACLAWAMSARDRGVRVELDQLGLEDGGLWRRAQERGIPRAAVPLTAGTLIITDACGQTEVAMDNWQEVNQWLSR